MALLFGRYEYVRDLGAGATGRVLLVRDHAAGGAERAIKTVPAEHAAWLSWEFARLSSVQHPRLARVYELLKLAEPAHELGLGRGSVLLVEEHVAGDSWAQLARALSDGPARERALFKVALGVAEALAAVHDAGLVHGDVKPANVLVERGSGQARLIDFGFARAPALRALPRGTPRTMAPELYAGVLGFGADVYALGASLYDVLGGSAASSGPVRSFPALPGVSGPLLALVRTLTAAEPQARPADGREALSALLLAGRQLGFDDGARGPRYALSAPARTPEALARRARTLPFVPYGGLLEELRERILGSELVVLRGLRGAGRTRLVREALRLCSEAWLAADTTFTWVDSLAAAQRVEAGRVAVLLDPASAADLAELERVHHAHRLAGRALRAVAIVETDTPTGEMAAVELRPASDEELRLLAGRLLDREQLEPELLAALRRASDGWPGRLCSAVAEACLAGRPLDARGLVATPPAGPLEGLSERARQLLEVAAWAPRMLQAPEAAGTLFAEPAAAALAFAELVERGQLELSAGAPRIAASTARALRAATRATMRVRLAPLDGPATPEAERSGFEHWLFGRLAAASVAWLRGARALRAEQRGEEAAALLEEALGYHDDVALRLELSDVERALARPARALAGLGTGDAGALRLARAELLRLTGERSAAQAQLASGFADAALAERAGALAARLAFDAGELARAAELARPLRDATAMAARARAREVELLVALARGEPDLALAEELLAAAEAEGSPRLLARALSLRGQVLAARGQHARAQLDARGAVVTARAAGEALEAATFALNLGLLEFEAGELGRALEALDDAAYRLCLLDRPQDLARVLYNLGNVALFIGDQERAAVVLREALALLGARADAPAAALARLAWSELCVVRGSLDEALGALEAALSELPADRPALRALILARASQVHSSKDALEPAARRLAEAEALDTSGEPLAAAEVALAGIRAALARGESGDAEQRARAALARFDARLPLPERVRLLLAASDAARAAGAGVEAAQRLALCRALLERVLSGLSPRLRSALRALPAHARVLESAPAERLEPAGAAGRFRTLLRQARRLFAEPSRGRLLTRAAELLLELVHAERVLVIMAREGDGELRVAAHADLLSLGPASAPRGRAERAFSRSVVERALAEQAAVVTLEAGSDARFDSAQSLHQTSVRSLLCVPLPGLPEPAALYLDDRMRGAAFSADDVALAEDLALLLAQALRALAARQSHERRARRAEEARAALEGELRLARAGSGAPQRLVFASAAMGRLLELSRRVAASDVPILISGESGTGKELIARHVHDESARRAGPFVAESCAALPETLLESALFGHVRGAFSGADRARKGLFELADGGTLLLDELGEMSPALQAKLLRVLQEGELRPLGSERTRKVDVRLIAATHRDLSALVQSGRFREDLYYRMAVVSLEVPPLRERRDDIALLAQHFVHKHAGGRRVSIDPAVLRSLELAPWPGNVRELENTIRRALALCQGRIELGHVLLDAPSASDAARADTLDLHAQTELLTRTLVEQALARAGGNLTQAAELLGVSRFGLQKMVKRFGLGPYVGRQRK